MPDRVVMRMSPLTMQLYDKIEEHAKTCETCRRLVPANGKDVAYILHRFGCLTAVLVTQEWAEEYARLHAPAERKAISAFGESVGIPDKDWGGGRA